MNDPVELLQRAIAHGMKIRPAVGGFPYLAEALRAGGVLRNEWSLPSCQSIYVMEGGSVAVTGTPLETGFAEIPRFDETALVEAIRADQAGKSTFPEFLSATWRAGVVRYECDFAARKVTYHGVNGEFYEEEYPAVAI